mmetsp:Transcript_42318/g.64908  ORF Transcript_42318/g.64908 Transcript_42318/m.64908 type:complete len:95 (-) Transcript_42318:1514-1798(-)
MIFLGLACVLAIMVLMCSGCIIELSQIGNRRDVIVLADEEIVNPNSYKDVNRKLLLEKESWTYYMLSFSFIRNNLHHLCKKRKKTELRQTSWKA